MFLKCFGAVALVTLGLAGVAGGASAESHKITMVRIQQSVEIAAAPAAVWTHLTTGKNLATWCPQWKGVSNAKVNLTRVGDVLDFTDAYGNGGRSVVTYLDKGKELRVTHEPDNGSYMCQARVTVAPSGKGARVQLSDSYTDESKPADMEATRKKSEADMAAELAALKKEIEGK